MKPLDWKGKRAIPPPEMNTEHGERNASLNMERVSKLVLVGLAQNFAAESFSNFVRNDDLSGQNFFDIDNNCPLFSGGGSKPTTLPPPKGIFITSFWGVP